MASRKVKDFEFRLGKLGLGLFVFGTSLSLLFAFVFGVIVGKNIESYPKRIVRSIPGMTKQEIIKKPVDVGTGEKKEEFKLTFYDTLARKSGESAKGEEKRTRSKSLYMIQVASFKDEKKAETLHKRLSSMGYDPVVDKIKLNSKGQWFRVRLRGFAAYTDAKKVAAILGKRIKGLKCMIVREKK